LGELRWKYHREIENEIVAGALELVLSVALVFLHLQTLFVDVVLLNFPLQRLQMSEASSGAKGLTTLNRKA
jgi:hypothetical protein